MTPLTLFIAISAVWRLTSLLCNETGPFGVFDKARGYAQHLTEHTKIWRAFKLYEGICCEWCASIWIAVPLVAIWFVFGDIVIWSILPFSISAWVIVMKYVIQIAAQWQVIVDTKADRIRGLSSEVADKTTSN